MEINPPPYQTGYEAKSAEIAQVGWIAARDEFNRATHPGQAWTGGAEDLAYRQGEYAALCEKMDRRVT